MRLTKNDRKAFIAAVMKDVPSKLGEIEAQAQALHIEDALTVMPEELRALYTDERCRKFITHAKANSQAAGYIEVPHHDRYGWRNICDPARAKKEEVFDQAYSAERKRLAELHEKLENAVAGCSTLKALKAALPEFEKYMPAERKPTTTALVVANVVADFAAAGWPKGTEK